MANIIIISGPQASGKMTVAEKLMDKIGYSYLDMYKDNIAYPVAKMDMKFIKSVSLSDKIYLNAKLIEFEPALIIKYTFRNINNEIIFKANTMQICVNTKTKETLYSAPDKFRIRMENYV